MVPIYHPAATVPHEVLEEERRIIAVEGWFTVADRYYANAFDADRARRIEAERRTTVRKENPLLPPPPLEQSLRKSIELRRVQDDDLVEWGEWLRDDTGEERYVTELVPWRELSCYERHTCERKPDGKLVGGFPI
jgi:hypothetical protein